MNYAGRPTVDTTNDYTAIHDGYANEQRDKLLIGRVSDKGIKALEEDAARAAKAREQTMEDRAEFAMNPFRRVDSLHGLYCADAMFADSSLRH
jgi:nitrate reductase (NAD(P)H)